MSQAIERYRQRRMRWGHELIRITFGVTLVEKRAIELLQEEARDRTGRDISQSLILQDMLDHHPDMIRMKAVAEKQLKQESSTHVERRNGGTSHNRSA